MTHDVLYLSYDGVLEPLGQSQVLAYLEKLAVDRTIYLLSFERPGDWADRDARAATQNRLQAAQIPWYPNRYHKRFSALATGWDIVSGTARALWLVYRHSIGIVHARSYVPAVIALVLKRVTGVKFIFDMRGFWADERVDGGLWPRDGRLFRVAKWFERKFLLNADHVVSLTQAAVREIKQFDFLKNRMPPVTVIPTCTDLDRFVPIQRPKPGFVLGYVGSAGTWYLFDEVVACFLELFRRNSDARLLVLNRNEHDYIYERLRTGGVPLSAVELLAVDHTAVPSQMARMHAGVFFYRPSYSRAACAPTKLGEFLGCGLPCLSNAGVGDMAAILEGERTGVALSEFGPASLNRGLDRLLELANEPGIRERCVAAARKHFSLESGVARYSSIYEQCGKELG